MEKIVLLLLVSVLLFADTPLITQCNECHNTHRAPPYKKIYKHYLLKYSSKMRIEKAMIDFLKAPSNEKSAMPRGMKRRFSPDEHQVFDSENLKDALKYIIEQEDIIARIKLVQD
jgi:hypothetical protein